MADGRPRWWEWWQTLPGMLTAVAAVVTALTGLIIALRPAAPPSDAATPPPSHASGPVVPASATGPAASAAAARRVALPTPSEVTLAHGAVVVRVLAARLEPYNTGARALVLTVRYTNDGPYPANFWNASFRLLIDDVPRAPTGDLNKVVDGHSAADGDVTFEVPVSARHVSLRVLSGDEHTDVPLDLTPVTP